MIFNINPSYLSTITQYSNSEHNNTQLDQIKQHTIKTLIIPIKTLNTVNHYQISNSQPNHLNQHQTTISIYYLLFTIYKNKTNILHCPCFQHVPRTKLNDHQTIDAEEAITTLSSYPPTTLHHITLALPLRESEHRATHPCRPQKPVKSLLTLFKNN